MEGKFEKTLEKLNDMRIKIASCIKALARKNIYLSGVRDTELEDCFEDCVNVLNDINMCELTLNENLAEGLILFKSLNSDYIDTLRFVKGAIN